ncbi:MAG: thioredoxin domain-containing protein [Gemmatimonadaceae bacterium]
MSAGTLRPAISSHDHAQGPADAPVTLVEYGDFQCPSCGMAYVVIKAVQRQLGDNLRFVFRQFPLTQAHAHAEHAAEAAEAAAAENSFWEMHDMLYEHQNALGDRHLVRYAGDIGMDPQTMADALENGTYSDRVREQFMSGVRSGVNGTPTLFINGERVDGAWNDETELLNALTSA